MLCHTASRIAVETEATAQVVLRFGPRTEDKRPFWTNERIISGAYTATNCMTNYTATIKLPATNPTYTITYGEPRVSRFDYYALAAELERYNREQLCRLVPIGDFSRDDGLIVAESWFEQPMLFGFPLISNPLSDPVPLYGHTIMRRIEALRGNGQGN